MRGEKPAFPNPGTIPEAGMDQRTLIAAIVLSGVMACPYKSLAVAVDLAATAADKLLERLEEGAER